MFKERFDQSDRYCYSMRSQFDQQVKKLDELMEMTRGTSERLASLEHDARQPRLAMEADGQADIKTRKRTEGAATAVQAMHGDSCSSKRVDPNPICSTNFGDGCIGPPALPCSREDALVDNGAAAPQSCLSPLEMRSPTAAGGLLPTGEASIATRTTFNQPPRRLYSTEETNAKKTSTQSVSYNSSFLWKNNLPAAPSCRRVIKAQSGQNRMFNPGGSRTSPRLPVFGNVGLVGLRGSSRKGWMRLQRLLEVR